MALVECKECKAEVSDEAIKCPKCGATLRKPTRSFFGRLIKWTFIGFNILMLYWLVFGIGEAAKIIELTTDEYEKTGAAIGTGIGAMLILVIWVIGDVILGIMTLLTRPRY